MVYGERGLLVEGTVRPLPSKHQPLQLHHFQGTGGGAVEAAHRQHEGNAGSDWSQMCWSGCTHLDPLQARAHGSVVASPFQLTQSAVSRSVADMFHRASGLVTTTDAVVKVRSSDRGAVTIVSDRTAYPRDDGTVIALAASDMRRALLWLCSWRCLLRWIGSHAPACVPNCVILTIKIDPKSIQQIAGLELLHLQDWNL